VTARAHKALVKEIIRQEVEAMIFHVAIPTTAPWSWLKHPKRACMLPGCKAKFDPPRWYSRFCSRGCGQAHCQSVARNARALKISPKWRKP